MPKNFISKFILLCHILTIETIDENKIYILYSLYIFISFHLVYIFSLDSGFVNGIFHLINHSIDHKTWSFWNSIFQVEILSLLRNKSSTEFYWRIMLVGPVFLVSDFAMKGISVLPNTTGMSPYNMVLYHMTPYHMLSPYLSHIIWPICNG